jgi:hypothetical protein
MAAFRTALMVAALLAMPVVFAAEPEERVFRLDIANSAVPGGPQSLRVLKNEQVRVIFTADAPCVIHLHGYNLEVTLAPGQEAALTLKASATGRFAINRHEMIEAPSATHRHDKPLAYLEVRPR